MPTGTPIVVDVVRGDVVESSHALDAVAVSLDGSVVAAHGDPDRVAYFRSSLKPVQASVCIAEGWVPGSDEQIAVACSSHNAEPAHLAAVRSILSDTGLTEDALRCPPALPLYPPEAARAGEPGRILRDCSGKHAAFLAASVARGWPLETYLDPGHPVQRAVVARTAELCGSAGPIGVDGCGAPTIAFPLRSAAMGFARGIAADARVAAAMRAHPFLVAGTARVCTDVMTAVPGDLVLKAGAEGILCFASVERGVGGAVKVRDGTARAVAPAALWLMQRLGLVPDGVAATLQAHVRPPVLGGGVPAGALLVRGT